MNIYWTLVRGHMTRQARRLSDAERDEQQCSLQYYFISPSRISQKWMQHQANSTIFEGACNFYKLQQIWPKTQRIQPKLSSLTCVIYQQASPWNTAQNNLVRFESFSATQKKAQKSQKDQAFLAITIRKEKKIKSCMDCFIYHIHSTLYIRSATGARDLI